MRQAFEPLKVLHIGNLFLDCPFTDMEATRSASYRKQKRETFRQAIEWAREEGVAMVLLTGDLVDNSYATLDTLRFLRECFSLAPTMRFVITPGLHDYIWAGSIYRLGGFGDNVTVFDSETPTQVHFSDLGVMVTGWGFCSDFDPGAPLRGRRIPPYEGISLVAGYASLGHDSTPAPVAPEDIAAFGGDYVGLSGAHMFGGFHKAAGHTVYAFSGALEHSGYGESGTGGANLITITPSEEGTVINAERLRFGTCTFATEELEVTGVASEGEIIERIRAVMADRGYNNQTALRVIFTGALPIGMHLPTCFDAEEIGLYAFSPMDETTPACDESAVARDMSVRGEVGRTLIPRMKSSDPEERMPAADALRVSLEVLGE